MSYYGNDKDGPNWGRIIWGVTIVVGLLIAVIVAMWELGFWFKEQGTSRTDEIYRQSYGYQQAQRDQLGKLIADVLDQDNQPAAHANGQLRNTAVSACQTAARINPAGGPLDESTTAWVTQNCLAGTLATTSPYAQ